MEKPCPYCQHIFGRPEASEFYTRQFSDFVFCSMCAEKVYIVIPTANSLKYNFFNAVVSIGPILLAVLVLLGVSLLILSGGILATLFPALVVGGFAFGLVFFLRRMMTRRLYWKFAEPRKSPFVE